MGWGWGFSNKILCLYEPPSCPQELWGWFRTSATRQVPSVPSTTLFLLQPGSNGLQSPTSVAIATLQLFAGETQLWAHLGFSASSCSSGWLQGKSRKVVNFGQAAHSGGAPSRPPAGSELPQRRLPIADFPPLAQLNCVWEGRDLCPGAIRELVS